MIPQFSHHHFRLLNLGVTTGFPSATEVALLHGPFHGMNPLQIFLTVNLPSNVEHELGDFLFLQTLKFIHVTKHSAILS